MRCIFKNECTSAQVHGDQAVVDGRWVVRDNLRRQLCVWTLDTSSSPMVIGVERS